MTDNSIILPIIGHLVTAVVLIFAWYQTKAQKIISIAGNFIVLFISIYVFSQTWEKGILTSQAGNWKAPFGITFVSDALSSVMVLLAGIAGTAIGVFSTIGVRRERMRYGFFPLLHFLLMGLNGAFLTGDIFNLYVWFEIIIIASFVLMTLGGRKAQVGGGIKYVTINLFASIIFLTAIAMLYGLTGSLNMADLSRQIAEVENRGLVNVTAMLFFVSFGIKAAVFPLYFWLPASYHTPPSAITAIFAGLLTKVGVYAMLRTFSLVFIPDEFTGGIITIVAIGTLLSGAFGALVKQDLKRIFSYFIICHIGYMIAGIAMFTEKALSGAVFYMIHDVMVKTNIFLIAGLILKIKGSTEISRVGGLYADYPKISLLIIFVLFSLSGVPPLSGFWPKLNLFAAAFDTGSYILIAALVFASFITLFIIAKIWSEAFWKPLPENTSQIPDQFRLMGYKGKTVMVFPIVMLAVVSLYIGLGAENIAALANRVAYELINTDGYVKAVLGEYR